MTAAAATEYAESNLDHLRTLIRLTVEFWHFLNDTDRAPDPDGLIYCCDSGRGLVLRCQYGLQACLTARREALCTGAVYHRSVY